MSSYDVGIIGAGVHGLTAAYHLARRGLRVVVFERTVPASGPTGQASGVVRAYCTNHFLAEVARAATAVLADFAAQVGGESGYVSRRSAAAAAGRAPVRARAVPDRSWASLYDVSPDWQPVQQGKALYVGISKYPTDRARAAAELLRRAGVPLLVHQPRYSLLDRRPETDGLIDLADEEGFGLVVYSPLAQGLLTDKYLDGVPAGARAQNSAFLTADDIDDAYREKARALNKLAGERGQSLAQLALQWALHRPQITSALIGASSTEQLDHNVRALSFAPLTGDELALIDGLLT